MYSGAFFTLNKPSNPTRSKARQAVILGSIRDLSSFNIFNVLNILNILNAFSAINLIASILVQLI